MHAPQVNMLSVVIGACRVIPEYFHFLAKLQAPANTLRLHRKHFIFCDVDDAAVRQLQIYHYFIPSHIKLPLTHHHNCKNRTMVGRCLSQMNLFQDTFVPRITKRIQQRRLTRRKSLLLMVGLKDLARPKVNKYGKKKRD